MRTYERQIELEWELCVAHFMELTVEELGELNEEEREEAERRALDTWEFDQQSQH